MFAASCEKDFLTEQPVDNIYSSNLLVDYKGFVNMNNALMSLVRDEYGRVDVNLGGTLPNGLSLSNDGVISGTPISSGNVYAYWGAGGSDMGSGFLVNKSFVKLRSVVLAWDLPKKWLAKPPFQDVKVSAYGNNLFLWTPSSNTFIDPETTSFGNDLSGNFGEWIANPSSRRFGFNLMVKF